ncbi:MAG: N-methyl-L-tryptophan oxidase [Planctomyces sp.]
MSWDVIVIGCGGFGSAALREFSQRGLKVLGLDQYSPPHNLGSSHGETRIIRKAYFEHPDYVPLLHRSWDLWQQLEVESGERLLQRCDLVLSGAPGSEVISGARLAAAEHGLRIRNLSAEEACREYSVLRLPEDHEVTVESTAGYLWVERCVGTMLRRACASGAEVRTGERVVALKCSPNSVEVQTTAGRYTASAAVVTCGPWTSQLLPEYQRLITVRRKTLFWYPLQSEGWAERWRSPIFLIDLPEGQFYGLPAVDGQRVKVGEHTGGDLVQDASTVERRVSAEDRAPVDAFAASCLRGLQSASCASAVCLYSMSPDGHFLFDRHPEYPLVTAAGFYGHGFKFTPVLGAAAADLIVHGRTQLPVQFLSQQRFD